MFEWKQTSANPVDASGAVTGVKKVKSSFSDQPEPCKAEGGSMSLPS